MICIPTQIGFQVLLQPRPMKEKIRFFRETCDRAKMYEYANNRLTICHCTDIGVFDNRLIQEKRESTN